MKEGKRVTDENHDYCYQNVKALNCTPNQNIWKIHQLQAALLRRASLRDIEILNRDDKMLCNIMIHTHPLHARDHHRMK